MLKSFKYRLHPSKRQARLLNCWLEECRWLYNHFLEERRDAWEQEQRSVSYHAQATSLPSLKAERQALKEIHSQVLQNVAVRVDLAFQAFFRRCKQSQEKPGYPRFKGYGRYDSVTFPQYPGGCSLKDEKLHVHKVGRIKIVQHRPLLGNPKTVTIRRNATGKWFACFAGEVEPVVLPESQEPVGIDVGLHSFTTISTGETVAAPKFFRQDEKALARAQRRLSKCEKGTSLRAKRRKVVAHIHERIANRRHNFTHQVSRQLVNRFGVICVEDLRVNNMLHNHCLAKSISDAAWSQFFAITQAKAAEAGRKVIAVNPAYTSQTCHQCGHRQPMPLALRVFNCPCCSLQVDRDLNASLNILRLGLQSLPAG